MMTGTLIGLDDNTVMYILSWGYLTSNSVYIVFVGVFCKTGVINQNITGVMFLFSLANS